MSLREDIAAALAQVADPRGGGDVIATGRAAGIVVKEGGAVGLVLALDGLDKAAAERLRGAVESAAARVEGVTGVRIILTAERGGGPGEAERPGPAPGISRMVAVASGKGGVGKSTVAANLAVALARRGLAVGLLDADIYGPSAPTLLGTGGRASLVDKRLQPMEAFGVKVLSMAMMTDPDKALVWRGPMASAAMMQMIELADWGQIDVMVIDLPPGTGDIQLTMAQKLKPSGAIIVSTPQDLALIDSRRAVAMFGQVNVPVLGIIENMSWFCCPHCGGRSDIFGHGGARREAERLGLALLGEIPLDMAIREASDGGRPPAAGTGPHAEAFGELAARVEAALALGADHAA